MLGTLLPAGPVPRGQVSELWGLEDVPPSPAAAVPELAPRDAERVEQTGQPSSALHPIPPRAGPERLEHIGRRDRLAVPDPDGVERLDQSRRGPDVGVGVS